MFDLEQVQVTRKDVIEYANVKPVSILVHMFPQIKLLSHLRDVAWVANNNWTNFSLLMLERSI
jgi:hypothetical protein